MDYIKSYISGLNEDVIKSINNLNKAYELYNTHEKDISEATKAMFELYLKTLVGFSTLIVGNIKIIENLLDNGEILQHYLNVEQIKDEISRLDR